MSYANPYIEALAKYPLAEKAARALATEGRGHDDEYWMYDNDVRIVLRETGALDIIREMVDAARAFGKDGAKLREIALDRARAFLGDVGGTLT